MTYFVDVCGTLALPGSADLFAQLSRGLGVRVVAFAFEAVWARELAVIADHMEARSGKSAQRRATKSSGRAGRRGRVA